jgi:hypothetical protein
MVSLMIAVLGALISSRQSNSRPASIGTPSVEKYPGAIWFVATRIPC